MPKNPKSIVKESPNYFKHLKNAPRIPKTISTKESWNSTKNHRRIFKKSSKKLQRIPKPFHYFHPPSKNLKNPPQESHRHPKNPIPIPSTIQSNIKNQILKDPIKNQKSNKNPPPSAHPASSSSPIKHITNKTQDLTNKKKNPIKHRLVNWTLTPLGLQLCSFFFFFFFFFFIIDRCASIDPCHVVAVVAVVVWFMGVALHRPVERLPFPFRVGATPAPSPARNMLMSPA